MRSSTSLYREFPTSSTSVQNKNSSSKRHQTHAFDPACSHMQADASHMMQQPSAQDRLDTAEAGAAADGVRQRGVKQHSSRSAMRLCAVLLVLLLLGVPLSVAGSEMAVPPVCASGSAEVQETSEFFHTCGETAAARGQAVVCSRVCALMHAPLALLYCSLTACL